MTNTHRRELRTAGSLVKGKHLSEQEARLVLGSRTKVEAQEPEPLIDRYSNSERSENETELDEPEEGGESESRESDLEEDEEDDEDEYPDTDTYPESLHCSEPDEVDTVTTPRGKGVSNIDVMSQSARSARSVRSLAASTMRLGDGSATPKGAKRHRSSQKSPLEMSAPKDRKKMSQGDMLKKMPLQQLRTKIDQAPDAFQSQRTCGTFSLSSMLMFQKW